MLIHQKSPESERIRFADNLLSAVYDQLDSPRAKTALGDFSLKLLGIVEMAYVPNIKNGHLVTPLNYRQSDKYPFFGIRKTETITLDDISAMPIQEQKVSQKGIYNWLKYIHPVTPSVRLEEDLMAKASRRPFARGTSVSNFAAPALVKFSRPFIAVSMDTGYNRHFLRSFAFHEFVHAWQFVDQPSIDESIRNNTQLYDEDYLRREREATMLEHLFWTRVDSKLRNRPMPAELVIRDHDIVLPR